MAEQASFIDSVAGLGGEDAGTETADSEVFAALDGEETGEGAAAKGDSAGASPAAAAGKAQQATGGDDKQQIANLNSALRTERADKKALLDRLEKLEAKINAPPAAAAKEEPEAPDFLADPKGYVDHLGKRLDDAEKTTKQREEDDRKAAEERTALQSTWNEVLEEESAFQAANADWQQAHAFVRAFQIDTLKEAHPDATPQQIQQHVHQQETWNAIQLKRQGRNPIAMLYSYAKRIGFKAANGAANGSPGGAAKPDKDAVRTMGSGGGERETTQERRSGGLSELADAHSEMKAERKKKS
jgi:hypothetical protein